MATEYPADDGALARRIDEVFGDVAPSVTSDELDVGEAAPPPDAADEELLANRPPHHDRD